jgi:hypothetical protein
MPLPPLSTAPRIDAPGFQLSKIHVGGLDRLWHIATTFESITA